VTGPLHGVQVVELASIGPGPFGCMLLADLGADVIRIERPAPAGAGKARLTNDVLRRNRRSICLDLTKPSGVELARSLVSRADVFVEGLRPGGAERLGLGPDEVMATNKRLIYARMTGWGQTGPLAQQPGHDINYIAVSGALEAIGRRGEAPVPPLNLVGDNGGGGMFLALGVVSALLERSTSGLGQALDVAMVDGSALLTANFHGFLARDEWDRERGANLCTGAPFYDTYETADGKYVAFGANEPKFYRALMSTLGFDVDTLPEQLDQASWPALKATVAERVRARTRSQWCEVFATVDTCFAPVLSFEEARDHEHARARSSFLDGPLPSPAPAPRFSRTPAGPVIAPPVPGAHSDEILSELGLTTMEIDELRAAKVLQ
jgi:alpha-methylacyl-CoA racemase